MYGKYKTNYGYPETWQIQRSREFLHTDIISFTNCKATRKTHLPSMTEFPQPADQKTLWVSNYLQEKQTYVNFCGTHKIKILNQNTHNLNQ